MIDPQVQDNSLAITAITSVSEEKHMAPEVIVEASEEEMTMVAAAIAPSQARVALMKFYQERSMHEQVDNVDVILSTYGLDQISASCVEKYGADPFAPEVIVEASEEETTTVAAAIAPSQARYFGHREGSLMHLSLTSNHLHLTPPPQLDAREVGKVAKCGYNCVVAGCTLIAASPKSAANPAAEVESPVISTAGITGSLAMQQKATAEMEPTKLTLLEWPGNRLCP
ncbi:hypothetical protein CYMTET_31248 [Cymbomonas tetramitiformis]|uniref:Uncharacterized protein n=1 Tax=Cymbomonas tetramitiformis TaxID=36881 RepID=A0AAE0FHU3_9CHLO|nr:hypothetical protein CYMTET_31248 [Cymbomonas tetramitiformis]